MQLISFILALTFNQEIFILFPPHILQEMVVDDIKECFMHVHFDKQEVTILGPRLITDEPCCVAGLRFLLEHVR